MNLIDTHAHIGILEGMSAQEVVTRANASGILQLVTVSVDQPSWKINRDLASKFEGVFYSLGLHPHEAKDWESVKSEFYSLFEESKIPDKCVGIGEAGLDFHYNLSPKSDQILALTEQLLFAKKINLPFIIHCRDAFEELYSLIREIGLPQSGGVMHCFTGDRNQAMGAVDLGLMISFSGILTFKNADPIRGAAKAVPLESIVIETDCPFLAPVPFRGKTNEPSYLVHTMKVLASVRGVPEETIAEATTQNAKRLFKLP